MEKEDKSLTENRVKEMDSSLKESARDVAIEIANEQNPDRLKQLVQLFNLNISKKNVARVLTYDELLDHISDQMMERLDKRADEFSNADLITYLKVMNDSRDRAAKSLSQIDEAPVINLNQINNTVNIGTGGQSELDRESRERVMSAVSAYLKRLQQDQDVHEVEFTNITSEDENININSSEETDV